MSEFLDELKFKSNFKFCCKRIEIDFKSVTIL